MSRNSLSLKSEINEEKKKILRWVIEWIKYPKNMLNSNNTDASDLASLLQCLGFTLNSFDKDVAESSPDIIDNTIKIEITCLKSNMKATMSKPLINCNCPSTEDAKNAEIWNVSGCEPANSDRINVSNNSILPILSPSKNNVLSSLLHKILGVINESDKVDINETKEEGFHPEPIIRKHIIDKIFNEVTAAPEETNLKKNRYPSCELEVIPQRTSSPICSQPLIQIDDSLNNNKLTSILKQIVSLGEEGLVIASNGNSTGAKKKRISDIKVSPLAGPNQPITGSFINMNQTRTKEFSLLKSTPLKDITPNTRTPNNASEKKKRLIVPPAKMGVNRKKATSTITPNKLGTPTTSKNLTPKSDTPRPNYTYKDGQKPNLFKRPPPPVAENRVGVMSKMKSLSSKIAVAKKK